jgi:hypothetical protein
MINPPAKNGESLLNTTWARKNHFFSDKSGKNNDHAYRKEVIHGFEKEYLSYRGAVIRENHHH